MIKSYSRDFYRSVDKRASDSAIIILNALNRIVNLSKVEFITDVGCGSGAWIESLLNATHARIIGIDLPDSIALNKERFLNALNKRIDLIALDFEIEPLLHKLPSDLTICLEVLEHLSENTGQEVIKWICKNSKIVVFSAATPGQGGTGHINEKPHIHWFNIFKQHGFVGVDAIRPLIQDQENCARYYALNTFVFIDSDILANNSLLIRNESILESIQNVPRDYRTRNEKMRFFLVKFLPVKFVTFLSKHFSY